MPSDFLEPNGADLGIDELPLGSRVGPYLIVDSLGRGGMGQVFLGNDVRLHRKVALKSLLVSEQGTADQRAHILREARAAAQINHPNVATIHDVIEHQTRMFMVMEYVQGENLAAVMRRERLPVDRVVAIGRQLAAALVAAHAKGVIHRDLKPGNIQLTVDGSVKVLDFGVAGVTGAFTTVTTTDRADETRGMQPGTRGYMSPEQMLNRHVDERTDIFSLGIVLFEMATGERAYRSTDVLELLDAVTHPMRRADAVDPQVPRALADLIARTLEVDPAQRFQSAAAVASALETLQTGRAVDRDPARRLASGIELEQARGPDVSHLPMARRRWTAGGLAVVIALAGSLAALAISAVIFWPGSIQARSVAVLPFEGSGVADANHLVAGLSGDVARELQRFDLGVKRVTQATALSDGLNQRLGVDLLVLGSVERADATTALTVRLVRAGASDPVWTHRYSDVEATLPAMPRRAAQDIARALGVSLRVNALAPSLQTNYRAYDAYQRGRALIDQRSQASLMRSIEFFKQAAERDPGYAEPWAGMADAYIALGVPAFGPLSPLEARRLAKEAALAALERNPNLAEAHTSLAFAAFFHEWDWTAAEARFKKAIDLNPQYALAHHWYADFLNSMGRQQEAMSEIRRAAELEPLSIIIHRDIAWNLFFQRRYAEAVTQLQETLRMDPESSAARTLLARALAALGRHEEALVELRRPAPGQSRVANLSFIAFVQASSGDRAAATATLRELRGIATQEYVPPYYLALIEAALGHRRYALDELERAYNEQDSTIVSLNVDPRFDSIRDDERFQALVRRMKFPPRAS